MRMAGDSASGRPPMSRALASVSESGDGWDGSSEDSGSGFGAPLDSE
jgi:hypothetical protein